VNHGQQNDTVDNCNKYFQGYARYGNTQRGSRCRRMFRVDDNHCKYRSADSPGIYDNGRQHSGMRNQREKKSEEKTEQQRLPECFAGRNFSNAAGIPCQFY